MHTAAPTADAARRAQARDSRPADELTNRRDLRLLDARFRPLPRPPPSVRTGGGGSRGVFPTPCSATAGIGLDAQAGALRNPVPVTGSSERRVGVDARALRRKGRVRVTVVPSLSKAARLLAHFPREFALFAQLLYGSGLRLLVCPRLSIKVPHFHRGVIVVREGKGGKHRVVMLAAGLRPALEEQLAGAKRERAIARRIVPALDCVTRGCASTRSRPDMGLVLAAAGTGRIRRSAHGGSAAPTPARGSPRPRDSAGGRPLTTEAPSQANRSLPCCRSKAVAGPLPARFESSPLSESAAIPRQPVGAALR